MKCTINVCKHDPENVESIELEDVASYEVTDKEIIVKFNDSPEERFKLVNNEEKTLGEWFYLDISSTRIGLRVDMSQ